MWEQGASIYFNTCHEKLNCSYFTSGSASLQSVVMLKPMYGSCGKVAAYILKHCTWSMLLLHISRDCTLQFSTGIFCLVEVSVLKRLFASAVIAALCFFAPWVYWSKKCSYLTHKYKIRKVFFFLGFRISFVRGWLLFFTQTSHVLFSLAALWPHHNEH